MSRLRLVLVALAITALAGCPAPASQIKTGPIGLAPKPKGVADPEAVTDGDITVAYENGLRILVKRNPGAELAAIHLYILGGAQTRTAENAGAEMLALETAVHGGTSSLDKDAFARKLTALGSDLGVNCTHTFSAIMARGLTEKFDETFALLSEAFLAPAMPDDEIEQQREQQLVGIKHRADTADGRLSLGVVKAVYSGHPYENYADGSVASVSAQTPSTLQAHLASLRMTSRLVLVVVGDIPADHVRELARSGLAKLPRGDFARGALPRPAFTSPKTVVTTETLPTNYVEASYVGPGWHDPEFAAGILGARILGNRIWEEVRTKRNLSYAAGAPFRWSAEVTRGALYVTAVDANTAIQVMQAEAKRLADEPVPAHVLKNGKSLFLTSHLMSNEGTGDQASWLALCDLVGGDWRLSRTLPERIRAVTAADIQAFAKKYIKNLQTVVLGDPAKIDQAVFQSL
jgi:zinc protease